MGHTATDKGRPKVRGKCPSCGLETLFLGEGGYVTCSLIGCRRPDAATELLAVSDKAWTEIGPTLRQEMML